MARWYVKNQNSLILFNSPRQNTTYLLLNEIPKVRLPSQRDICLKDIIENLHCILSQEVAKVRSLVPNAPH